jgi:hypothetical protein
MPSTDSNLKRISFDTLKVKNISTKNEKDKRKEKGARYLGRVISETVFTPFESFKTTKIINRQTDKIKGKR